MKIEWQAKKRKREELILRTKRIGRKTSDSIAGICTFDTYQHPQVGRDVGQFVLQSLLTAML